jgi:hypothetical protein
MDNLQSVICNLDKYPAPPDQIDPFLSIPPDCVCVCGINLIHGTGSRVMRCHTGSHRIATTPRSHDDTAPARTRRHARGTDRVDSDITEQSVIHPSYMASRTQMCDPHSLVCRTRACVALLRQARPGGACRHNHALNTLNYTAARQTLRG